MSLDTAIARFRRDEQKLMRSECVVKRAPAGSLNAETLTWSVTPETIYTGKCLIRPFTFRSGEDADQGDSELRLLAAEVTFPFEDAPTFQIGDIVEPTSSPDQLVGRAFRITDIPANDWVINRKVQTEEVRPRARPV